MCGVSCLVSVSNLASRCALKAPRTLAPRALASAYNPSRILGESGANCSEGSAGARRAGRPRRRPPCAANPLFVINIQSNNITFVFAVCSEAPCLCAAESPAREVTNMAYVRALTPLAIACCATTVQVQQLHRMLVQQRDPKLRASPAPWPRRRNLTSTMPRYLRIINIQHHLQCAL